MKKEGNQWYDVGIIKGTSCVVSHYHLPSEAAGQGNGDVRTHLLLPLYTSDHENIFDRLESWKLRMFPLKLLNKFICESCIKDIAIFIKVICPVTI